MIDINLLNRIHDDAWLHSSTKPIGRVFLLPYLGDLTRASSADVLHWQMINFDASYNIAFLSSCPEIWQRMSAADWLILAKRLQPRRQFDELVPHGMYADIGFFMHVLDLDLLGVLIRNHLMGSDDQPNCLRFARANAAYIDRSIDRLEDFDGVTHCEASLVTDYRATLVAASPDLAPKYTDCESFKLYVDSLARCVK